MKADRLSGPYLISFAARSVRRLRSKCMKRRADTLSVTYRTLCPGQDGGHKGGVTPCPLSGCPPFIRKSVRRKHLSPPMRLIEEREFRYAVCTLRKSGD